MTRAERASLELTEALGAYRFWASQEGELTRDERAQKAKAAARVKELEHEIERAKSGKFGARRDPAAHRRGKAKPRRRGSSSRSPARDRGNTGRILLTPYRTGRGYRVAILQGEDGLGTPLFEEVHVYPDGGMVSARPRVTYRSMPEARRAIDAVYREPRGPARDRASGRGRTLREAQEEVRAVGYSLRKAGDEYQVKPAGEGSWTTGDQVYYASDLDDAVATAWRAAKASAGRDRSPRRAAKKRGSKKRAPATKRARRDPMQVANTILAQLGGRRFLVMTGAKASGDRDSLILKLPARLAKKGIRALVIKLEPDDTYSMRFVTQARAPSFAVKDVATHEGVYAEDLRRIFEAETGLYASMGTMGRDPSAPTASGFSRRGRKR